MTTNITMRDSAVSQSDVKQKKILITVYTNLLIPSAVALADDEVFCGWTAEIGGIAQVNLAGFAETPVLRDIFRYELV